MTFDNFTVKELKKIITRYNKSVRVSTYSGVGKKRRAEVVQILSSDFNPQFSNDGKTAKFKHKSGRFTRKIKSKK